MPSLYLIDANSYLFRSYYAIAPVEKYRHDRAKSAVYGFARMLMRLIHKQSPDYIAIAFDTPAPATRRKRSLTYRAKRPMMPPDLRAQIPYIKEVINGLSIPVFELDGYDADDILASIASGIAQENMQIYMITGFKDALQLADRMKIINPHQKNLAYDKKMVEKRFGIAPGNMPLYLALAGDDSENIPGVKGIGAKKAAELVNKFASLKRLLENADSLEKNIASKIKENRSKIEFGYKIARMDPGVPVSCRLEDLALKKFDYDKLIATFRKLEFIDLLSSVSKHAPSKAFYRTVLDQSALEELAKELKQCKEFSFDTETTGVNPHKASIVGMSFSTKKDTAWYIPLAHRYQGAPRQIEKQKVFNILKPIFEDEKIKKAAQNAKYDLVVLDKLGIEVKGLNFDTMLASYVLNPSTVGHSLETMALQRLDHKMIKFDELVPKNKIIADIDIEKASEYACEDVDMTLQLKGILEKEISQKGLSGLFDTIEMPLCFVLEKAEQRGILVNKQALLDLEEELSEKIKGLEKEIYNIAGRRFNLNSQAQISNILFDELKLPWPRKTRLQKASTARKAIEKLSRLHPIVNKIIRYKELSGTRKNLILPLIDCIEPSDKRVRPIYSQIHSPIGMITTSSPDFGAILSKKEFAGKIKKAFIAPRGFSLVNFKCSGFGEKVLAQSGPASDIIKKSLVEVDKLLKQRKSRAGLVLQALDEFIYEIPESEKGELVPLIKDTIL